jgi:hypothetical protein
MGSKSNPSKYDCYSRAEPDEPVFVLLGRDPAASLVVKFWVELRKLCGETEREVLDEAFDCAVDMAQWCEQKLGKYEKVRKAYEARRVLYARDVEKLFERVRTLEALCHRAADVIREVRLENESMRMRDDLCGIEEQLRDA